MIFAARQMSYSRLDSSPVASGWSRSCSMMNRSIVMTSDPCTMAVRGESDRAPLIGPQNRDAVPRQPLQHLGRRMARHGVTILRTDERDRKSTRLNSSHGYISYAVFCLKKKKKKTSLNI